MLDLRLVRLFSSIPSEENYYRDMGHYLHRRAVAGLVPDLVVWKKSKYMGGHATGPVDMDAALTAGTIFHRSRKPLQLWFRAMWYVTNQKYGANALGIQRVLGLGSYNTAREWLPKLRRAMVRPGRDLLVRHVQVDETYIGGPRPGRTGRGAKGKSLVVIAAENGPGESIGRIRLGLTEDASAKGLAAFVTAHLVPGTTVQTDD